MFCKKIQAPYRLRTVVNVWQQCSKTSKLNEHEETRHLKVKFS